MTDLETKLLAALKQVVCEFTDTYDGIDKADIQRWNDMIAEFDALATGGGGTGNAPKPQPEPTEE
jgi:hypothetical protein